MTKNILKIIVRDFSSLFMIFFYLKYNNYQIINLINLESKYLLYILFSSLFLINIYLYFLEFTKKLNNQVFFILFILRNLISFLFFSSVIFQNIKGLPFYINNYYLRVIPTNYSLFLFDLIISNSYKNTSEFLKYLEIFKLNILGTYFVNLNEALAYFDASYSEHLVYLIKQTSEDQIKVALDSLHKIYTLEQEGLEKKFRLLTYFYAISFSLLMVYFFSKNYQ